MREPEYRNLGALDAPSMLAAFNDARASATGDPLVNPVAGLASTLFLALEAGAVSVADLSAVAARLGDASFEDRARAFHERRGTADGFLPTLKALAGKGFEAFRARIERAAAGVVFTAHPTFALGAARRALVGRFPLEGGAALDRWRADLAALASAPQDDITLRYEHGEASKAIAAAQDALDDLNGAILGAAREAFPGKWRTLRPNPISIATWVGYDLDGRSDIHWSESIRIRIAEKAAQLTRYQSRLAHHLEAWPDASLSALCEDLGAAAALAARQAEAFAGDLGDPEVVVGAANLLTEDAPGRLISLHAARGLLSASIDACDDDEARQSLVLLRAQMDACGLGLARIHLRVNAAQVRSALRADLGLDPDTGFMGRSALDVAAQKTMAAEARSVNFGSVFLEKMTARRQFMLCAQILKHIDADTPIRFLIAECEAPATVMGAVYLARLYGVDSHLDISPLFETPEALEAGGRFIERLLREPEFRDYVEGRGRMAIQLGFSDSGRFMGQCAAGLAIERLQVLFARALADARMTHVEALVFNTHGESMGRGAHPGGFAERLDHLASPWVRSRFARDNIALAEECSFQGGEGFLHFQTPALARETLRLVWTGIATQAVADPDDRFYADINYSWDFYRGLKGWQEALFQRADYRRTLSGFAQQFLYKTGSRQAKRAKGDGFDLSALRAIPHNAILQQLCAPVNVSGGFGAAAGREGERLVEHVLASARMRGIARLAANARCLTDLSVLRAYASFYAPRYWSSLAMQTAAGADADSYEAVQRALGDGDASAALHSLADFLSQDLRRFDAILGALDDVRTETCERERLSVLHAMRLAMMARAVALTARVPAFSRRHDIARHDLVALALEWRLEEACSLLREIFPARPHENAAFDNLAEQVESHDFERGAYPEVHARIIEPLDEIAALSRVIAGAIANHYGAFG